jgi:hypothetical protein
VQDVAAQFARVPEDMKTDLCKQFERTAKEHFILIRNWSPSIYASDIPPIRYAPLYNPLSVLTAD